eukprot:COSAG04_NODE_515_length_13209_cov_19.059115_3_plen_48_part_00
MEAGIRVAVVTRVAREGCGAYLRASLNRLSPVSLASFPNIARTVLNA